MGARRWGRQAGTNEFKPSDPTQVETLLEIPETSEAVPQSAANQERLTYYVEPPPREEASTTARPMQPVQQTFHLGSRQWIPIRPKVSLAFNSLVERGQRRAAVGVAGPRRGPPRLMAKACRSDRRGGTLVWLRPFDLRIHDNPALNHAAERRKPVHIVFAWSDDEDASLGEWRLAGTAAAFFLHHALASLEVSLRQRYGLGITIRKASSISQTIVAVLRETGADQVVTSKAYEQQGLGGRQLDSRVKAAVCEFGATFVSFNSFLLHDLEKVKVDLGTYHGHFGTLTPFHLACMEQPPVSRPLPDPTSLMPPSTCLANDGLDCLGLATMPLRGDGSVLDWGAPILESWDISEEAALATLRRFLSPGGGLQRYEKGRHLANASAVTRISPYLRFGMLSCRRMYHEMKAAHAKEQSIVYWRRLVWRDLAYWQLLLFPKMQNMPIRAHYEGQQWCNDRRVLERWQRGLTGYPLVDAGMRELWATGWMAQNVRMVAAILLCEYLNIHWVEGERWFHHTLVDADLAINAMMWQNAGKSGLDQWNFTMNPGTAGRSQDPTGEYVREWCPELAKLPLKYLHTPWEAPPSVLHLAGVALGPRGNYPDRIVSDLDVAAKANRDAIRDQRRRTADWSNDGGYDLIVLPRGSTVSHDGQLYRIFTKPEYRVATKRGSSLTVAEHAGWEEGQVAWTQQSAHDGFGNASRKGRGKGHGSGGHWVPVNSRSGRPTDNQSVLEEYMNSSVA